MPPPGRGTRAKLDLVSAWQEAGVFSARERTALAWTEALTSMTVQSGSEAPYVGLQAQFSETGIIFPAAAVSAIDSGNRIAGAPRFDPPIQSGRSSPGVLRRERRQVRCNTSMTRSVFATATLTAQLRPHIWPPKVSSSPAGTANPLLALFEGPQVIALAGFRMQENLVHGRHLYVGDLVTDETLRGLGHGGTLCPDSGKRRGSAAAARSFWIHAV